jgi:hypothetical protein
VSKSRVFPSKHATARGVAPNATTLSILDATVAAFTPCAAAWIYDKPSSGLTHIITPDAFRRSLEVTLDSYPQWAGQLGWAPIDPNGEHTARPCRPRLVWGSDADPGVDFIVARCEANIPDAVPDVASRRAVEHGCWDAASAGTLALLPPYLLDLALRSVTSPERPGAPCMVAQLTSFACGGFALAIGLTHPLADAQTLVNFARDWAAVHTAMTAEASRPLPELAPVFDPTLLDAHASGDIDAPSPNAAILAQASSLPAHRYDWWASGPGAPEWATAQTLAPVGEAFSAPHEKPGVPLPWHEWDLGAPVARTIVHFAPAEVARIWAVVSTSSESGPRVSRLDALLAHLWACIVRARGLGADDDSPVHLDVTLGVRARTGPPLPDAFVGSPLVILAATLPAAAVAAPSTPVAVVAGRIRATVAALDPSALGAYLHERAHARVPHRTWGTFLGLRHTLVTSWLGLGIYAIDFGAGAPRYIEPVMPDADGCVQVMEAGARPSAAGASETRRWHEEPVGVRLHLREDVMRKLLADPLLRMYA